MTVIYVPKESFSFGEISPSNFSQVSKGPYQDGAKDLENSVLTRFGGAARRSGSRYHINTPGDYKSRIFTYRISSGLSVLTKSDGAQARDFIVILTSDDSIAAGGEVGQWLTIYYPFSSSIADFADGLTHSPLPVPSNVYAAPGTIAPAVLTVNNSYMTPYTEAQLDDVQAIQFDDGLYFIHPEHAPLVLKARNNTSADVWAWGPIPYEGGPPQILSKDLPVTMSVASGSMTTDQGFYTSDLEGAFWRIGGNNLAKINDSDLSADWGVWYRSDTFVSPTEMDANNIMATNNINSNNTQFSVGDSSDWCGPFVLDGVSRTLTTVSGNSIDATNTNPWVVTMSGATITEDSEGQLWVPDGLPNTVHIITSVTSGTNTIALARIGQGNLGTAYAGTIQMTVTGKVSGIDRPYVVILADGVTLKINEQGTDQARLIEAVHATTHTDQVGGVAVGGDVIVGGGSLAARTESSGLWGGTRVKKYDFEIRSEHQYKGPFMKYGLGWSAQTGFPSCGTVHQSRLYFGGFAGAGNTVISSKVGEPNVWKQSADDDAPLSIEIRSAQGSIVTWMESFTDLLIGTDISEFKISGAPITPSNIGVDLQTSYGGRGVQTLLSAGSALFVGRSGENLRELSFSFERDRYVAPDLTDVSSHLFEDWTIERMAYAANPSQILYVLQNDGTNKRLLALTLRRENGVVGWSPAIVTEREFQDVAWLPSQAGLADGFSALTTGDFDEVYAVLNVEYPSTADERHIVSLGDDYLLDSEKGVQSGDITVLSVTGYSHLAGLNVQVLADSVYVGSFLVGAGGGIDWSAAGFTAGNLPTTVRAGIGFTFKLTPTIPEFQFPGVGATQGMVKNVQNLRLLVRNTKGLIVEGDVFLPAVPAAIRQDVITAHDGWITVDAIGESGENIDVTITQNAPYSCEIGGINFGLDQST